MAKMRAHEVYEAELRSGTAYLGSFLSVKEAEQTIRDITRTAWWRRRTTVHEIELRYKPRNKLATAVVLDETDMAGYRRKGLITLVGGGLCPGLVYHELGHIISYDETEDHGPKFIKAQLDIIYHFHSPWAAKLLEESYQKAGLL